MCQFLFGLLCLFVLLTIQYPNCAWLHNALDNMAPIAFVSLLFTVPILLFIWIGKKL